MGKEKSVCRQSAVGIGSATSKISVDLILRNEHFMLIPCKTVSCLVGDSLFRKLPKLSKHPVRGIVAETHDRLIFLIRCRQPLQAVNKVSHVLRLRQILRNSFCLVRVAAGEKLPVIKDKLRYAFRHISFHEGEGFCVFREGIAPRSVQHHLRSVLALIQELLDSAAYLLPREKCFIQYCILYRMADRDLHAQLVKPHGIRTAIHDKAFSALAVLAPDKFCVIIGGLVDHVVIDDAELTSGMIAAGSEDFIHDV